MVFLDHVQNLHIRAEKTHKDFGAHCMKYVNFVHDPEKQYRSTVPAVRPLSIGLQVTEQVCVKSKALLDLRSLAWHTKRPFTSSESYVTLRLHSWWRTFVGLRYDLIQVQRGLKTSSTSPPCGCKDKCQRRSPSSPHHPIRAAVLYSGSIKREQLR